MSEIQYISAKEFIERGYLQEVNRQFLHPLGLALEVTIDTDDPTDEGRFSGVWDYRKDPEGMQFGGPTDYGLDYQKAAQVEQDLAAHRTARKRLWGQVVQPLSNALDKR